MRNIRIATSIFVIALVLVLILASPVSAGLRVSGTKIQDTLSPGEVQTYVMNVGNTADEPMDITVAVMGLGNYLSGTIRELTESNDGPFTARTFTNAIPTSFHLEPGQSQDVTVTINMPADVGDGGRYADIFIYTAPSGGGQIGVSVAVSAQVLLTIKDSRIDIFGNITSIDMLQAVSGEFLSATATIQNTGNYHYKLTCNGTVRDSLGQVVGTVWQTNSIFNLIPPFSQQVPIALNVSQELVPGTYNLEVNAYTQDGVWLDTEYKTFVLTAPFIQPPLNPLKVEFIEGGQLTMYQWSMDKEGTLMEDADATSLSSSINILIRQGTNVLWAEGQSESNITVTPIDPTTPSEYVIIDAYDFSPDGVSFDPIAYITMAYSPDDIPEGISETQLRVGTFDEDSLQWIFLESDNVELDTDANTITFPIEHFSVYAVLVPEEGGGGSSRTVSLMWVWMVTGAIAVVLIAFSINTIYHRRAVAVRREQSRRRGRPSKPQGPRNDSW